jgi:hypothetical protein
MASARILLDTYRERAEQWCWRTKWHIHGESAMTLFWKFALLNQLTARELAPLITNRTSGRRSKICVKPDVDLRDASVFDLDQLAHMFRIPTSRIRRAFLYEILPGSVLRSHGHLRWCTQCLDRGFHSPLFQMRQTQTCPLHEHRLREACPACGYQIPFRLNNPFVLKPFCCPRCGTDLAPGMNQDRPELLRLRQEHISNLSLLLQFYRAVDADQMDVDDSDRLFISARKAGVFHVDVEELGIHSRYASFIAQVVDDAAPGLYMQRAGLRLEPVKQCECGCWRPISSDDDDEFVDDDWGAGDELKTVPVSEVCLSALIDTYKAIRRRLWRQVLRKHQRCVRSAAARMGWRVDGQRTGAFCSQALAFIRWRMLWEGCGTPRYLFAQPALEYYGIIGWHLARPCQVPSHWSTPTKAWISSHIFAATCFAAFDEISCWADTACKTGVIDWTRSKSPIDYTCLWAVAGRDCCDRPATIYLRSSNASRSDLPEIQNIAAHWQRHQADIERLQR